MERAFTVGFIGHSVLNNPARVIELLEKEVVKIIREKEMTDFLVGRNGEFDLCVASTIVGIKKNYRDDNNSLILVLPYSIAEYTKNYDQFHNYYDDVEISYKASVSHPKSAIRIRNREIVDRADMIICYIEHESGNAWQTVKYAKQKNKPVINLAGAEI